MSQEINPINNYNISSDDNNNINLEEISILFSDNFINLSNIKKSLYNKNDKPENIKLLGKLFDYDLWSYNNIILIGFPNSPTKSWYKIKTIEDINVFINYFTNKTNLNYNSQVNLYLDIKINFNTFIKLIYMNNFVEKVLYEDMQDIKTNKFKKLTEQEKIENLDKFTDKNSFIILTEYSKSLLEFKQYNNNIILSIKYNKLNLRNRYDKIDKYIPSDINIVLNNFNILTHNDLLKNITIETIDICNFILFDNRKLYKNILTNLLNNKSINTDDTKIKEYINKKINEIEIDEIYCKLDKDGTFKAFENSLDILIKTIYEKISLPDKNYDLNMTYINDNIKNKIMNLLINKLI